MPNFPVERVRYGTPPRQLAIPASVTLILGPAPFAREVYLVGPVTDTIYIGETSAVSSSTGYRVPTTEIKYVLAAHRVLYAIADVASVGSTPGLSIRTVPLE